VRATVGAGRRRVGAVLFALITTAFRPSPSFAVEAEHDHKPAPKTVEEAAKPLGDIYEEEPERASIIPRVRDILRGTTPFLRDTELVAKPRSFFFSRRNDDGTRAEAWALGGAFKYKSGFWKDFFGVGATLYTSQRLVGKKRNDGSLLLQPRQRGYTVVGEAYATLRYDEHRAALYRQSFDLPYVNRQDSRMTPNTFEAYMANGQFGDVPVLGRLEYVGGYIARMKPRDRDDFSSMSKVAGVDGSSEGMVVAGARIQPTERFTIGAVDYHVEDTINIAYGASQLTVPLNDRISLLFGSQFTYQTSVGDDLLTGSSFDTWVAGARVAASYRNAILTVAFSTTDDEQRIRNPFGSYPGYLSLMQRNFNRAGEDAWLVGLSYHFERIGLPDLSAFTSYTEGYDARDGDSGESLPDHREFDFTLDYRIGKGRLDGLWIRVRLSVLDVEGRSRTSNDGRLIVNYDLPLL